MKTLVHQPEQIFLLYTTVFRRETLQLTGRNIPSTYKHIHT